MKHLENSFKYLENLQHLKLQLNQNVLGENKENLKQIRNIIK